MKSLHILRAAFQRMNIDTIAILQDAVNAYEIDHDQTEFDFVIKHLGVIEDLDRYIELSVADATAQTNEIHRSELWRTAVISATNAKHRDPVEFADKVLKAYSDRFVANC